MPAEDCSLVNPEESIQSAERPLDPDTCAHAAEQAPLEPAPQGGAPLLLPSPGKPGEAGSDTDLTREVLRFHLGDTKAAPSLAPPGDGILPAILHPFRDPDRVRNDYPLFLYPPTGEEEHPLCIPLSDLLEERTASFAQGPDDARILKDNLRRLERRIRASVNEHDAPAPADKVIREAANAVEDELALHGDSAAQFAADLARLVDSIPVSGRLLPFGEAAPLRLFLHAARRRYAERFARLREHASTMRRKMQDIVAADEAKGPEGRNPETLARAVGSGGMDFIDVDALSHVLDASNARVRMPEARRMRIEKAIGTIDQFLARADVPRLRVVHDADAPTAPPDDDTEWTRTDGRQACAVATEVFDSHAADFASLHGVIRIARLESQNQYDQTTHDPMLDLFDWQSFTKDELLSIPPVLVIESESQLAGAGMAGLSRLLLSGRPISVLVSVHPASNPGSDDDPMSAYRFELANLGVGHREALVNQSCATRPHHLAIGFERALEAVHASLHVVSTGLLVDGETPPVGSWVHAGAAMEARAHPLFHYNPEAGDTWARRFEIDDNPQPESEWAVYELQCRAADGTEEPLAITITFADYALLEPCYREHYRVLPPSAAGERFVPLARCLAMTEEQSEGCVPFIWGADEDGRMHRLAVTRPLLMACRDRLDYWRTLQELAGVRNEHVREAVARERQRLEEEFGQEKAAIERAADEQVEQARTDSAREALARVASALLSVDAASLGVVQAELASAGTPAPIAPPDAAQVDEPITTEPETSDQEAAEADAPASGDEEVESEEPWINSPLCTTCNDCLNINPQVFVYNSSKQAVIADPHAGTYEQLVQAAEKCPARCIHPGSPLNPDEPNLEELIERARPFNT